MSGRHTLVSGKLLGIPGGHALIPVRRRSGCAGLEIRGIGIIDVRSLYGVGAVKSSKSIDIVAYLEEWDESKYYDRLGLDKEYEENPIIADIKKINAKIDWNRWIRADKAIITTRIYKTV